MMKNIFANNNCLLPLLLVLMLTCGWFAPSLGQSETAADGGGGYPDSTNVSPLLDSGAGGSVGDPSQQIGGGGGFQPQGIPGGQQGGGIA
jgi:hypothetical protein